MYRRYVPYGKYIIRKCFPESKEIRILDLGCGFGGFLKVIKDAGYSHIEGIEFSGDDVAYAHHFGLKEVLQGDILEMLKILDPQQYDIVLLLDVIEHFERDQVLSILNNSFRILKTGGSVVIHVPNAEGIFGSRIRYSDYTHEMAYTAKSLAQISTYAGFVVPVCFEDKPIPHKFTGWIRSILWPIVSFPFRMIHVIETGTFRVKLSQNILFKTEKP